MPPDAARLEPDDDDPDGQTLLLWYPSVTRAVDNGYVRPAVRIESGAKSALDPHRANNIVPYIADDLREANFSISGITTVDADRTLWDKVVILHGLRKWLRAGARCASKASASLVITMMFTALSNHR